MPETLAIANQTNQINSVMNILEALKSLAASGTERVKDNNGTIWGIDILVESINEVIAEDRLEDTSDGGEWVVDGDGVEKLDADGFRTGNRYIAALDLKVGDAAVMKHDISGQFEAGEEVVVSEVFPSGNAVVVGTGGKETYVGPSAAYPDDTILYGLPDAEFETGGLIDEMVKAAGYDESGRTVINGLNLWNSTLAEAREFFRPESATTSTKKIWQPTSTCVSQTR